IGNAGAMPDHISTDLHRGNVDGPVFSLALTMSKMLHLHPDPRTEAGMDLFHVIAAASLNPAQTFSLGDLITRVAPSAPANLTVFQVVERELRVQDSERQEWTIPRLIVPRYAIVRGVPYEATRGVHGMNLQPEDAG